MSKIQQLATGDDTVPVIGKLGLDVDSTLYPLIDAMGLLPGGDRVSYAALTNWDALPELCGGLDEMLALFDEAMAFEMMERVGLYSDAVEQIQQIAASGVEIVIVTDRPSNRMADTEDFLHSAGIPFASVEKKRSGEKVEYCLVNGIDVLVDDHPQTIAQAAAAGLPILALDQAYNRPDRPEACKAYPSWRELGPAVRAELDALTNAVNRPSLADGNRPASTPTLRDPENETRLAL